MNCVACNKTEPGPSKGQAGHEEWIVGLAKAGWFVWSPASRVIWHGVALCPPCASSPVGKVLQDLHGRDMPVRTR